MKMIYPWHHHQDDQAVDIIIQLWHKNNNKIKARSWTQSEDGLTWTFKLRSGLVWSDGEPLRASDYIFALQRAATTGYDFAWYWGYAGGIENWDAVTKGREGSSRPWA